MNICRKREREREKREREKEREREREREREGRVPRFYFTFSQRIFDEFDLHHAGIPFKRNPNEKKRSHRQDSRRYEDCTSSEMSANGSGGR